MSPLTRDSHYIKYREFPGLSARIENRMKRQKKKDFNLTPRDTERSRDN